MTDREKEGKHTPGPWKVVQTPDCLLTIVGGHTEHFIAYVGEDDAHNEVEERANAELLASAPRLRAERDALLAALQEVVKHHARYDDLTEDAAKALRDARAAIRRCWEGESWHVPKKPRTHCKNGHGLRDSKSPQCNDCLRGD
ncbi:MAG: hypothetical protein ACYTEQ_31190 [Planctomycetota bacterium]|jgi:hypothetical protein